MLTDWERQELEALRKLVRIYSKRIEEQEAYANKLERQIEKMQSDHIWTVNPEVVIKNYEVCHDQSKCNTSK